MYSFNVPELDLSGEIYGNGPVQAVGTVRGFPFYFRARWDEWTFSISKFSEIDPVDIQFPDQGEMYGYFRESKYGEGPYDASWMEEAVAFDFIKTCVIEFLEKDK
jgi:hypothetical protein